MMTDMFSKKTLVKPYINFLFNKLNYVSFVTDNHLEDCVWPKGTTRVQVKRLTLFGL